MFVKKGKFYGVAYSDDISELDFYGKLLCYRVEKQQLLLSFQLMNVLDKKRIVTQFDRLQFFEIEDSYITKKIITLLNDYSQVTKIVLQVDESSFVVNKMKVLLKGIRFQTN